MRRSATWSTLLLSLLILQAASPLAYAFSTNEGLTINQEDTEAPLVQLAQLDITPKADAVHGWGELQDGILEVGLANRDASPIPIRSWKEMTSETLVDGWVILQHEWPVPSSWYREMAAAGIDCYSFLPPVNFHCNVPNLTPAVLERLEVTALMRLDPTDKVHPNLPAILLGEESWPTVNSNYGIYNLVLSGESLSDYPEIVVFSQSERWATVGAEAAGIALLANDADVEWIEPKPISYYTNDVADGILNSTWVWENMSTLNSSWGDLDGSGITVTVADSGIHNGVNNSEMHGDFKDHIKDIVSFPVANSDRGSCSGSSYNDGASDTHSHGTHVAGSVLGDGTNSSGNIKGSAPEAQLYFQAFEQLCSGSYMLGLPDNFKDFMDLGAGNGSVVHTNSWSSKFNFGEYNAGTMQVDTAGYLYKNMTILFAAGNDGVDISPSDGERDEDSLGSPATGKNVITVGASENDRPTFETALGTYTSSNTDNISGLTSFSSRGPTDDGRLKPDIAAPGSWILSAMSNYARASTECQGTSLLPNSDPNSDHYCYMSGTSMATPLAAGTAALLYQHLYDNVGHENVSSSLIKAIMTANANDMMGQFSDVTNGAGEDAPNIHEGWGRMNMRTAVQTSFIDNEGVETGEIRSYSFVVPSSAPDLRVMLAWTDPASTPAASTHLINELNLSIKKPDGTWVNDSNNLDNIIGADFSSPASGVWEVHINGSTVSIGPQFFSVALSANYTLVNLTEDADKDGTIDDDDDCPSVIGFSTQDRQGCPDTDGDGYSDADGTAPAHPTGSADAFPSDATQWENTDGDAYGDNPAGTNPDDCISVVGTSTIDRIGCPDGDGDGYSTADATWTTAQGADGCDSVIGNSTIDRNGCLDTDGDGYSNPDGSSAAHPVGTADALPNEKTQWEDSDGDGYGDNWNDTSWNASRAAAASPIGQWILNAFQPDECETIFGSSIHDRIGCPDNDNDGYSNPDATHLAHPNGNADAFPTEPSQWNDTDGDGFGDNPAGTNADDCPSVLGSSIEIGSLGCPDTDSDGTPDNVDDFPNEASQDTDTDSDGYGDDAAGYEGDDCPSVSGTSFQDGTYGCLDSDLDGYADIVDAFPNEITQWNDTDGDGFGDNAAGYQGDGCPTATGSSSIDTLGCPDTDGDGYSDDGDAFNSTSSQWRDSDGDGYGDNPSPAELYDECPTVWGNSSSDRQGCFDSDGDGYSNPSGGWDATDGADAFPNDKLRWVDDDGDGFDDDLEDACDSSAGNSTIDRKGCLDSDGDGYSDAGNGWSPSDGADAFPNVASQWSDADGDGYGDNPYGLTADDCIAINGNSTIDRTGCLDSDGDGYSNPDATHLAHPDGTADAFPNDSSQWEDADGDGYGDRLQGTTPDDCPTVNGDSSIGKYGCIDSDGDGVPNAIEGTWTILLGADAFPDDNTQWKDADVDGYGDNPDGAMGDACPTQQGDSDQGGKYGCIDSDGDGWGDEYDDLPTISSQWLDSDGDGYGDNVTTGALMIDHWPSDENKNVAEVYLTCTPDSLTGDPNEAIDITITCTVTNQISIPLVVVVRWDFTQGITASMIQRPVNLGASGAADDSISITFTGRASYTENIDSTILVMEPGGTKNLDIESFVININAPPVVTTNTTNNDDVDVVNQSWSKYIPIDPNDASMTLPFFGSIVLVMLFIARRISVKGRKGFNTMSDVAKKNVEQSRVSLTRSSSVLERPPPPLPPDFNIK